MPEERLLRIKGVCEMVGFSASMVYRLISEGKFPRHRTVMNCSVWKASEVQAWINEQWDRAGRKAS